MMQNASNFDTFLYSLSPHFREVGDTAVPGSYGAQPMNVGPIRSVDLHWLIVSSKSFLSDQHRVELK